MRNRNTCIICENPYQGNKGLACPECHQIVNDHHQRIRDGSTSTCRVLLQDRWVYIGTEPSAKRVEKMLIALFNGFPAIPWNASGYADVKPLLPIPDGFYAGGREARAVPAAQSQAIADLVLAIRAALMAAEKSGIKEGRNLLAQLAAGELTNQDFERRAGIVRDA